MSMDYNHLLSLFDQSNKKYIDFNIFFKIIDKMNLSNEQKLNLIKKVYSQNFHVIEKLEKEVKLLENISNDKADIATINLKINKNCNSFNYKDKEIKEVNVDNYIKLIDNFKNDIDFELLNELIDDNNFDFIINKIILYYYLESVTLQKLIKNESDLSIFNEEAERYSFILSNLKIIRDSRKIDNKDVNNNIIFLKTSGGNINFLNDLNEIPQENYNFILNAFNSILDGTFKNMKRIGKNEDGFFSPLLQVRDNCIRIFYIKVLPNLYLINGVIVKKCSTNSNYSTYIRKLSYDAFYQREDFLKLNDIEKNIIINESNDITNNVIDILSQRKKVLK